MGDRAERLELAIWSDVESHRADAGGTALLVAADLPLVLNRHGVIACRQYGDVGLRIPSRRAQRDVAVEEQQLLGSRLGGNCRDDLHPMQAAVAGMSSGDFDPFGARYHDRDRSDGLPYRVSGRPVGILAGVRW